MLQDLIRLFTGATDRHSFATDDVRLALTALLIRVARVDGTYSGEESDRIARIVGNRFALGPFEAASLLREAEELEKVAPDTVRFTRVIKDAVAYEEREGVMEALWDVALADGIRNQEENAMLRLTANLLGVNDRDSALARQRVESRRA